MLEREAELRVLERLVAQAAGGDGRVGLIEGLVERSKDEQTWLRALAEARSR